MTASIGIDLGGTHVLSVLMTASGTILHKVTKSVAVGSREQRETIIEIIAGCINELLESTQAQGVQIIGLGMAVPGNVDPTTGSTRYLPNFGWLEEVPLSDLVSSKLTDRRVQGMPIVMRNDGRCAALAESRFGVGRGAKAFAMLTIGTGIGGALIREDGNVFDGCSFDAGDFGHHVMRSGKDAFDCVCGKSGCFEAHASARGLVRHFIRQRRLVMDQDQDGKPKLESESCTGVVADADLDDARSVFEAMRRNEDECSTKAWHCFRDDLTTGLANLITFYNPDIIALGGGLAQAQEIYIELEAMVDAKTLPATRGKVRILPSLLGTDSGAVGAALLGFAQVTSTST